MTSRNAMAMMLINFEIKTPQNTKNIFRIHSACHFTNLLFTKLATDTPPLLLLFFCADADAAMQWAVGSGLKGGRCMHTIYLFLLIRIKSFEWQVAASTQIICGSDFSSERRWLSKTVQYTISRYVVKWMWLNHRCE